MPPKGLPTRPTTDIAKEGLFNILTNNIEFEDERFLDLFAGTGNISYEMASRGCNHIVSVDRFPKCVQFIEKMIDKHDIDAIDVQLADVFEFIDKCNEQFTIIFAGPPYGMETLDEIPDRVFASGVLEENGIFVLEHNPNHNFDHHPKLRDKRNYGQTIFSFFVNN